MEAKPTQYAMIIMEATRKPTQYAMIKDADVNLKSSTSWRRIEPAIVPDNIEPTDHQHRGQAPLTTLGTTKSGSCPLCYGAL